MLLTVVIQLSMMLSTLTPSEGQGKLPTSVFKRELKLELFLCSRCVASYVLSRKTNWLRVFLSITYIHAV